MDELNTILGTPIQIGTRGILYLCHYSYRPAKLTVGRELFFTDSFAALNAYSNIPNPESQLVMGETYDELITNLHTLHKNMEKEEWLKELGNAL